MSNSENLPNSGTDAINKELIDKLHDYVSEREQWLGEAAVTLGFDSSADPLAILPKPQEVRSESPALELDQDQEAKLRDIAGRFGVGGEEDALTKSEYQIIEGGLAWKIAAELAIAEPANAYIVAGSPYRNVSREDEVDFMKSILPDDLDIGATEYDIARQIAQTQPGFQAGDETILPFGYTVDSDHEYLAEKTGQFVKIGINNGADVIMMRVDRDNFIDYNGETKYRNQPDSAALMGIIADILSSVGDTSSAVGLNTSNTYASRQIDAVRAGVKKSRQFDVGMYGRETLAEVKNEAVAQLTPINQIPGELYVIAEKLAQLKREIA